MKELSAEVYWKLCEELSVDDASHLIIGILPDEISFKKVGLSKRVGFNDPR